MRTAGEDQWSEVQAEVGEDEQTLTVTNLDPLLAYEFRLVAHNARGRSAGESTGPLSLGVIPQGELAQPRARATSSQA